MKLAVWLWLAPALVAQDVTVTGTVTNAITHEPISGVTIRVFGSNDVREISTDANGVFRAEGLHGCCRVLFDKDGFEAGRLQFRAATNPAPLNLTMLPWPTLGGRVLDTERQPIGGSTVQLISMSWGDHTATAGSDGGFAFRIPPGEYVLYATPATSHAAGSTELAPTYYPDSAERRDAERLVLKAGNDLSGYDIVIRRVPVFKVSGRVVDERGEGAASAALKLSTAGTKTTTDRDGNFELARVRPGNDLLQADWQSGTMGLRGLVPVRVANHDIENVIVRVAAPVVVSGTVGLDGKPAQVEGTAFLEPVEGNGTAARAAVLPSGIHFDGIYPGRYRIEVQVNTGFGHPLYLDSVRLGERDITAEEFEVAPGILPFHVELKTGGGRVRGTVKDGTGGIVVLVPEDERLRIFMAVSFFTGDYFALENVRPGDYYAFAVNGTFNQGQMRDPAYAAPRLAGAPTVRVEGNGTATLTLSYARVPGSY